MLLILKKTFLTWLLSDIFRYDSQKKSPMILYTVNLGLIPTDLLKQCTDTFLPVIKDIINISVGQEIVPALFKVAHVRRPSLKN